MKACTGCGDKIQEEEGKLNAEGEFVCFSCAQELQDAEDKTICGACGESSEEYEEEGVCPSCGAKAKADEDSDEEDAA